MVMLRQHGCVGHAAGDGKAPEEFRSHPGQEAQPAGMPRLQWQWRLACVLCRLSEGLDQMSLTWRSHVQAVADRPAAADKAATADKAAARTRRGKQNTAPTGQGA